MLLNMSIELSDQFKKVKILLMLKEYTQKSARNLKGVDFWLIFICYHPLSTAHVVVGLEPLQEVLYVHLVFTWEDSKCNGLADAVNVLH